MNRDIQLDPLTHDLVIDDRRLNLIGDPEHIRQNVKQRLLHFRNEWFLNLREGTPWIEQILIKGARVGTVGAILKQRIAGTPGIRDLVSFSITAEGERGLSVAFAATTNDNTAIADTVQVVI